MAANPRDGGPDPHDATPPNGATRPPGPTAWWRYGLVVLAVLVLVLALMQIWQGAPGTDVQPGTPTIAPDVPPPPLPTM